jgi:hypothetical protein
METGLEPARSDVWGQRIGLQQRQDYSRMQADIVQRIFFSFPATRSNACPLDTLTFRLLLINRMTSILN